jgi:type I restriction enzyme M protein
VSDSLRLVDKLWAYCNVLRDDGVGVIEYTEQLTYSLFLKTAHEQATRKLNSQQIVPDEHSWHKLLDAEGTDLEVVCTKILVGLAQQPGMLGTIFRKSQNRIQDPAKLKRFIVDLIDRENWSASSTDLKGDAYEARLSKGASDKRSGAAQYFTSRDLIRAIVDVTTPRLPTRLFR